MYANHQQVIKTLFPSPWNSSWQNGVTFNSRSGAFDHITQSSSADGVCPVVMELQMYKFFIFLSILNLQYFYIYNGSHDYLYLKRVICSDKLTEGYNLHFLSALRSILSSLSSLFWFYSNFTVLISSYFVVSEKVYTTCPAPNGRQTQWATSRWT